MSGEWLRASLALCVLSVCAAVRPGPQITSIAFSPDGKMLAAAQHHEVVLVDAGIGKVRARLRVGSIIANSIAFIPDNRYLVAAGGMPGQHGEIQAWDVASKQQRSKQRAHKDMLYSVAVNADSTRLAASSYDRTVSLCEITHYGLRNTQPLVDHTDAVYAVAFSPNGSLLASASGDRTVKMWEVATGRRLFTLSESTAELYTVAWSPDSKQLAAGGVDRTLRVWNVDASGGTLARSTFAHDAAILRVLFAIDGKRIITSGEDRQVKLWDAETLEEQHVLERQSDWPMALALSPDGKRLAVGRYDGTLALYDAASYAKAWDVTLSPTGASKFSTKKPTKRRASR